MRPQRWLCTLWLLFVGLTLTASAYTQTASFKVPYASTFDPAATLKVKLGFNAGPHSLFVVDTGSVGIVVPRSELPATIAKALDGQIKYVSSGLVVDGFWTEPIDVTLDGSGAVAHVSVFAATQSHCLPVASNPCHPGSLPHMMGVGFGRPELYATPDRNPLVNLGNLPPGRPANYRLTHTGIELGIPHASAIPGMHLLQLTRWTRPGLHNTPVIDDRTPAGSIRLNGAPLQPASILIDTGITDALLALATGEPAACMSLPRPANTNCDVANGTRLSLDMLNAAAHLAVTLGDQGAATPSPVHWIRFNSAEGSFINTGIHPLARFDVFYDHTHGTFGLSPASP